MTTKTTRIETWNVTNPRTGKQHRVGRIVCRNADGTFDGATNYRQASKVGQVRKSRR